MAVLRIGGATLGSLLSNSRKGSQQKWMLAESGMVESVGQVVAAIVELVPAQLITLKASRRRPRTELQEI